MSATFSSPVSPAPSSEAFFTQSPPREFFAAPFPVFTARAPGRLDVMGGISDYSGGTCLEWPLACATRCAVQPTDDGKLVVFSANAKRESWQSQVEVATAQWMNLKPSQAQTHFEASDQLWARYVLGAFIVLRQNKAWPEELGDKFGAHIYLESDVPSGAGVSSSASVEVAAMAAIIRAFKLDILPKHAGLWSQQVENQIAGAPCGVMDQLTVALGRKGQLLRLKCQPDLVEGFQILPEGVQVWGIDSGVKHAVGGGAYGRARVAAMMGRRILRDRLPQIMRGPDGQMYLANIDKDIWRALRDEIPFTLRGEEFLRQFGSHEDDVTTIDPNETYQVRLATEHPIYEASRTKRFAFLLQSAHENPLARRELLEACGELMIQSHFSYDHRCNLGAPETDLLVKMAREIGPHGGILGAKITGGGSGGTVAFLTDNTRNTRIESTLTTLIERYKTETNCSPTFFAGSSDGAFS